MKIAVIGTGYVGLVAGACFADMGNTVECVDIDAAKISALRLGEMPIYEPGLQEIVKRNAAAKRLSFTTDAASAVMAAESIFIAVGTPQGGDGEADLRHVLAAAETIAKSMNGPKIVVEKSTVPVGTSRRVKAAIEKRSRHHVSVVSNPEFLREGSAVGDFLQPDRVIVGSDDRHAAEAIAALYAPLGRPVLITTPESAELIKYASNAFLAAKISFINEVANLSELVGADIKEVSEGMGLDTRIGRHFLDAGCGWGGSCFPKDVKALRRISMDAGCAMRVVEQAAAVNEAQKLVPFRKLKKALRTLAGKRIAVLGLSFKPDTDDMREASSIAIIRALLKAKARVAAADPAAVHNAEKIFGKNVEYAASAYDAANGADAIVLVTEWKEFRELDFRRVRSLMKGSLIVDGRNIYGPKELRGMGFTYMGIGR